MSAQTKGSAIADKAKAALQKSQRPGTFAGLNSAGVQASLEPYKLAIANSLPNGGSPDRIIQLAVYKISTDPKLAECSARSVIGCVLNSSLLGLNPALKQCHFVPRKNRATGETEACFQFDYRGMVALSRRSGIVADVFAQVVRKSDQFEVRYGTDKGITHVPKLEDESEDFIAVYAVIRYTNGGHEFAVMTPAQIAKRRAVAGSKNPQYDFWEKWKAEMWKKTVLHYLLQTAPLSDEQAGALQTENATLSPENFQRGEIRPETVEGEYEDVDERPEDIELKVIADGIEQASDLLKYWEQGAEDWKTRPDVIRLFVPKIETSDALESFWKMHKPDWAGNSAVIEIFNNRKKELEQ